jgi:hypothetical protein
MTISNAEDANWRPRNASGQQLANLSARFATILEIVIMLHAA